MHLSAILKNRRVVQLHCEEMLNILMSYVQHLSLSVDTILYNLRYYTIQQHYLYAQTGTCIVYIRFTYSMHTFFPQKCFLPCNYHVYKYNSGLCTIHSVWIAAALDSRFCLHVQ